MTKETKIGLLVGLAFIILFGIILSEKGTSREEFSTPSMSAYKPVVELVPPKSINPPQLARAPQNIVNKLKMSSGNVKIVSERHTKTSAKPTMKSQNPSITTEKKQNTEQIAQEIRKLIPVEHKKALTKKIPASAPINVGPIRQPVNQPTKLAQKSFDKSEKHDIIGTHLVTPGETLAGICKKYYPGRAYKMIKKVMALNNISRPERLRAGQKIKLPADNDSNLAKSDIPSTPEKENQLLIPVKNSTIAAVVNLKPVKVTLSAKNNSSVKFRTYIVRSNDSLCKIARKFYGTEQAWIKIYNLNRDILSNPDRLRSGIKLKLPPSEELAVGPKMLEQ